MNMFASVLAKIPKNRSELLTELDYPDYVTLPPHLYELYEKPGYDSDSSESSIALSENMIVSDNIENYVKPKIRVEDPWQLMRESLVAFPQDYLDSLSGFYIPSVIVDEIREERDPYVEELYLRMLRFFEEECRVFDPDDPGLRTLERAIDELDLESDTESRSS